MQAAHTLASSAHCAAAAATRRLWRTLLAPQVLYQAVFAAFEAMEESAQRAERLFRSALERFPQNKQLAEEYVSWKETARIAGLPTAGDSLMGGEGAKRGSTAAPGRRGTSPGGEDRALSETTAVVVVDDCGRIQSCSRELLALLGHVTDSALLGGALERVLPGGAGRGGRDFPGRAMPNAAAGLPFELGWAGSGRTGPDRAASIPSGSHCWARHASGELIEVRVTRSAQTLAPSQQGAPPSTVTVLHLERAVPRRAAAELEVPQSANGAVALQLRSFGSAVDGQGSVALLPNTAGAASPLLRRWQDAAPEPGQAYTPLPPRTRLVRLRRAKLRQLEQLGSAATLETLRVVVLAALGVTTGMFITGMAIISSFISTAEALIQSVGAAGNSAVVLSTITVASMGLLQPGGGGYAWENVALDLNASSVGPLPDLQSLAGNLESLVHGLLVGFNQLDASPSARALLTAPLLPTAVAAVTAPFAAAASNEALPALSAAALSVGTPLSSALQLSRACAVAARSLAAAGANGSLSTLPAEAALLVGDAPGTVQPQLSALVTLQAATLQKALDNVAAAQVGDSPCFMGSPSGRLASGPISDCCAGRDFRGGGCWLDCSHAVLSSCMSPAYCGSGIPNSSAKLFFSLPSPLARAVRGQVLVAVADDRADLFTSLLLTPRSIAVHFASRPLPALPGVDAAAEETTESDAAWDAALEKAAEDSPGGSTAAEASRAGAASTIFVLPLFFAGVFKVGVMSYALATITTTTQDVTALAAAASASAAAGRLQTAAAVLALLGATAPPVQLAAQRAAVSSATADLLASSASVAAAAASSPRLYGLYYSSGCLRTASGPCTAATDPVLEVAQFGLDALTHAMASRAQALVLTDPGELSAQSADYSFIAKVGPTDLQDGQASALALCGATLLDRMRVARFVLLVAIPVVVLAKTYAYMFLRPRLTLLAEEGVQVTRLMSYLPAEVDVPAIIRQVLARSRRVAGAARTQGIRERRQEASSSGGVASRVRRISYQLEAAFVR